ncbi:hypothetical protein [Paenibacillus radicis (ex Xue et al. 2023)]|uniref:Uncharacterized protein n=1 Tax=Paenibacillus radicis (ex Xue et al. 2023) TaxID=2972489 RepID=A0ABT1YHP0_9BACL|nr:hypothetical protein [Paenibacillus radicis (ex Xue et al. 2023)]MCR8632707.1 hypothetical protein [Paenibacillus radicis (ex Xue et al. 2023)]
MSKLIWTLGQSFDADTIKRIMVTNVADEMTVSDQAELQCKNSLACVS